MGGSLFLTEGFRATDHGRERAVRLLEQASPASYPCGGGTDQRGRPGDAAELVQVLVEHAQGSTAHGPCCGSTEGAESGRPNGVGDFA